MRGFKLYVFIVIPFVLGGLVFLILYKNPLYLISGDSGVKKMDLVLTGYTDKAVNGGSVVGFSKDASGKISYKYTLRDGAPYPYVGIQFSKKDSSLFDLTAYDFLKIKIKASSGTRIPFTITSDIQGYSKKEIELTYRTLQYVLTVNSNVSEISAPIKEFATPNWWYATNNMTEKDLKSPDFSRVKTIQLNNCINLKKDIEDVIEVEEISFNKDLRPFYIYAGVFVVLYFGLGFLFLRKKKEVAKIEINFQYEKTDVINYEDKEEEAVFGFITSNYSNAELTIIDVQQAIGIHERKISAIIKKKTELNFKQFLNKLRIAEAKRLLLTSSLQISEIAFKVGYGNASHFNRVFKVSENCAPNDFRKEHASS